MKIILTFFILLHIGCDNEPARKQIFLNELGSEKAKSYNVLMNSYENFLKLNYPDKAVLGERSRAFMNQIIKNDESFKFDSLETIKVLSDLEHSGLRKDIFLYSSESYEQTYDVGQFLPEREQINIDLGEINDDFEEITQLEKVEFSEDQKRMNLEIEYISKDLRKWNVSPNENGLFNYAVAKAIQSDTAFFVYLEIRNHGLSPALTDEYMKLSIQELELWKNQIPLVIDFYLHLILSRYGKYIITGS